MVRFLHSIHSFSFYGHPLLLPPPPSTLLPEQQEPLILLSFLFMQLAIMCTYLYIPSFPVYSSCRTFWIM